MILSVTNNKQRGVGNDNDALLEDGPVQLPKPLSSCISKTSEPFVRKKRSEEAYEEHVPTDTVREGKPKVAGLDMEETEKIDRDGKTEERCLEWCLRDSSNRVQSCSYGIHNVYPATFSLLKGEFYDQQLYPGGRACLKSQTVISRCLYVHRFSAQLSCSPTVTRTGTGGAGPPLARYRSNEQWCYPLRRTNSLIRN
ncbi:hypothetical protein EDD16DRAFT_1022925 [Pisolithus croceorrhizus]|nr:hypothetical protein EDD16DRAFT_1022925 [Pisolithus croceorrhizus]